MIPINFQSHLTPQELFQRDEIVLEEKQEEWADLKEIANAFQERLSMQTPNSLHGRNHEMPH